MVSSSIVLLSCFRLDEAKAWLQCQRKGKHPEMWGQLDRDPTGNVIKPVYVSLRTPPSE